MHWLADKLRSLNGLAARWHEYRVLRETLGDGSEARSDFVLALREAAQQVAEKEGVIACFIEHEGLVFESSGPPEEVEALAAAAQIYWAAAGKLAVADQLGEVRQILLIGAEKKLALFRLGAMSMGIVGAADAKLAESLA